MASTIEIEFFSDGFKQILNSDGVRAVLEAKAKEIQSRANANIQGDSEGYRVKVWRGGYGGGRLIASVYTTDWESLKAESENKALSRAVK